MIYREFTFAYNRGLKEVNEYRSFAVFIDRAYLKDLFPFSKLITSIRKDG